MPISTSSPFTIPFIPFPVTAEKSENGKIFIFFSEALFITASPNGCSEAFSIDAAKDNIFSSLKPLLHIISVTTGFPSVIVPVLSKIIVSVL